jgi:Flagellar basal body-associated protein
MNKKIIIVLVVIILAMGGFFGYTYFVKPANAAAAPSASPTPKLETLQTYSAGDSFITNIKDSKALCKLSASIAYASADKAEFLTNHNALIRSCILGVIRNHTEDELKAPDAPQALAKEMVAALNQTLETDIAVNVYISDYVVQ